MKDTLNHLFAYQTLPQDEAHRVVLGIAVMAVYVTAFNRLLWRPLYAYSERRLRIQ